MTEPPAALPATMRAAVFRSTGGPDVLEVVERPVPAPGPGEVLVRITVSGVNPTDWKTRQGLTATGAGGTEQGVHHDGAGRIVAVGPGVPPERVGQRVWTWLAAWRRPGGTAQEYVALPADRAVALPDGVGDDLGAALGVPALTAHRALTVAEGGPERLAPGALNGAVVLVAGGAGAVGHAAIELARWAGATVVATTSTEEKAALARAAGAHHVVLRTADDAAEQVRAHAPDGVDVVVEVAPAVSAALDLAVCRQAGTVAYYANEGGDDLVLPVRASMSLNLRWQGVLLYTVPERAAAAAVEACSSAAADGALRVGEGVGLPLHRFPLDRVADAHAAVEARAVGKVLVDVAPA